ncbi:MAG: HD domain-containing protein [Thermoanaerobaculaceae bacterium]|nr:HD domain-containing protein [Thermoanaerobaculaceae bacterium]
MGPTRGGSSALLDAVSERGWRLARLGDSAVSLPPCDLDTALRMALDLAGEPCGEGDVEKWHEPLLFEAKRRLYPETFPAPSPAVATVAGFFVPLAKAVLAEQERRGEGIVARLPFRPLDDDEIARWPSGEEYRRMLRHIEDDWVLVCLAMVQAWQGFSTYEHVLGVAGLSLWIGRQLARVVPVDLPLLHGAAVGHDIGKFGCVGDEVRRIPRLHYYYTHTWYQDRGLLSIGHIATTHSVWDLELVRLPVETLLLIYADFRVKESSGPGEGMGIISLAESFATIRDKLENLDREKIRRYRGVYRKLRDLEEYLQFLGVELNPPGFDCPTPARPSCPKELDIVAVLAGRERPDAVALATGRNVATIRRLLVTAHNLGVMERLRDLPALRALLEEARSFESWRDLRTYLTILGEYAPALSREQKALAFDFFMALLGHRDDDIRYHAANGVGDLLAGREDFWRKDLPDGIVLRPERVMLDELGRVLALLDLAKAESEDDMAATERVLYAVPIVLRRLLRRAEPDLRRQAWERIKASFEGRLGDQRPLVGLYVCEALEVCLEHVSAPDRPGLAAFATAWCEHPVAATRLMAWRLLLALARDAEGRPEALADLAGRVETLAERVGGKYSVAELFLLQELADACALPQVAELSRKLRLEGRDPVREVFLRNLKSRVDWVEKKVNCNYLISAANARHAENRDPGSYFANEVASHFANLLKVSRVEGTRFHAGRCLLELLPLLTVPQRNDLMVELLRSLELDLEAVTRYIPRFLAAVLASLPDQEFFEGLEDVEVNVRRGSEALQRLLLQTVGWLLLSLQAGRLKGEVLHRLAGMLLGSLAESRSSTAVEGFAQIAMVLERLAERRDDGRLRAFLLLASKKFLALITHRPGDRVRYFLVGSALNHLDRAIATLHPALRFPEHPTVAFIPGTYDPFTSAHQAVVVKALESASEAVVQMDDYSWRKHALPRQLREELAWMALAAMPDAYLAPFRPPVNLARPSGVRQLRHAFGGRQLLLVVGSDVLAGASAYADGAGEIWDIPHVVVMRDDAQPEGLLDRIGGFRGGVAVVPVSEQARGVSSTALRSALDRRGDLEALCHPLVARTLLDRRLYVNYPAYKQQVPAPDDRIACGDESVTGLDGLRRVAEIAAERLAAAVRDGVTVCTLEGGGGADPQQNASVTWRNVSAAALPVVLGDERLALAGSARLLGQGALVESIDAAGTAENGAVLQRLLSEALGRWLDAGLLFGLVPLDGEGGALSGALQRLGAALPARGGTAAADELAVLRLEDPLVLVWDVEGVLQPPYAAAPAVRRALAGGRTAIAEFFAAMAPGNALLHLHEEQLKRRVVQWAIEILGDQPAGRHWVTLGLGRQFSRDIVGNCPTLAVDLERFLTWQGYEGGTFPLVGSPSLELQLAVARELARNALVLAPFLDSADAVVQLSEAAQAVGLAVREVLIGVTSAAVRATLELRGIPHRCGVVVPGWQGVLRESAMAPYVGGWSIVGRDPLEIGSLLPSLNDCLPYHHPHHLGLAGSDALDFSRLALHQARALLLALEETFREREGRLLAVQDLSAVVRTPRCPPMPQGFLPPRDRFPSDLVAEDIEALARLHPETHAAHRGRWRER